MDKRDWLTPAEVAHELGISRPRVWQLLAAGRLVADRTRDGVTLIPRASVDAYEKRPRGRPSPKS